MEFSLNCGMHSNTRYAVLDGVLSQLRHALKYAVRSARYLCNGQVLIA